MKRKYFLASSCARWFFGYNYEAATEDIERHLDKVYKFNDIVSNLCGNKSPLAVNHILGLVRGSDHHPMSMIVSEYATRWLTLQCDLSIIKAFLNQDAVKKNPAFEGWVIELKFLTYIHRAHERNIKIDVWKDDNTVEKWSVKGYTDFDPDNLSKAPEVE